MENLSIYNPEKLALIIGGILECHNYNDPIDKDYQLEFKITENETMFQVNYNWFKGVIPGTNGNPELSKDNEFVEEANYFKILKTATLQKFTKEVMDAISEVTAHEFEAEMSN